jgi:uncharacterized protein
MISIVSPAKSLNFKDKSDIPSHSEPLFLTKSQELVSNLKMMSPDALSNLMSISKNLSELNHKRFQDWELPFNLSNSKQAAFAFTGDVFKGIDMASFNSEDLDYSQNKLRILSGLYGILKPLDLIQPYRLEMGTKLNNKKGSNLYHFWGDMITDSLNQELEESDSDILLNLASNEYFKSINSKNIKGTIITPSFLDWKNGQYKMISFFAKRARGMMVNYQIKNQINKTEDLKGFDYSGYCFDSDRSSADNLVFLRRNE